jgi:hypothetical protein
MIDQCQKITENVTKKYLLSTPGQFRRGFDGDAALHHAGSAINRSLDAAAGFGFEFRQRSSYWPASAACEKLMEKGLTGERGGNGAVSTRPGSPGLNIDLRGFAKSFGTGSDRAPDHQGGGINFCRGIGLGVDDALIFTDRVAEYRALAGIGRSLVKWAPGHADAGSGDKDAMLRAGDEAFASGRFRHHRGVKQAAAVIEQAIYTQFRQNFDSGAPPPREESAPPTVSIMACWSLSIPSQTMPRLRRQPWRWSIQPDRCGTGAPH